MSYPGRRAHRYHHFILACWTEADSQFDETWRFTLQEPSIGKRVGFSTPQDLAAYLQSWVNQMENQMENQMQTPLTNNEESKDETNETKED